MTIAPGKNALILKSKRSLPGVSFTKIFFSGAARNISLCRPRR